MKASYNLFHDSPARRADYVTVTECENFPSCFCATRWVEDQKVAERLCSIWENIKKMTKYWEALPKSKRPKWKSDNTVVEGTKDELTLAKLEFFGYIANLLHNILSDRCPNDSISLWRFVFNCQRLNGFNNQTRCLKQHCQWESTSKLSVKIDSNWICCRT